MEDININTENTLPIKKIEKLENTIKPTKPKTLRTQKQANLINVEITYDNYIKNLIDFKKCKLTELKDSLKKYNSKISGKKEFLLDLKVSGKKEVLIERLEIYFKQTKNSIAIQRLFRGWIVRHLLRLKGPGLKNTSLCVNDSDFVTMEPLNEISKDVFYSYKDSKGFVYGFDITSLVQMLQKKNKFENPYNREKIGPVTTREIKTLYNLSFLVYPHFKDNNERIPHNNNYVNNNRNNSRTFSQNNPMNNVQNTMSNNRTTNNTIPMTPEMLIRHNRLLEIREKPVNERINHLFTEIDSLGNYTSSTWFSELDFRNYVRLYRILYDIWFFRSNMSREVRNLICPNTSPFDEILPRILNSNNFTFLQIQNACLTAFENMVYRGTDDSNRILGAYHALTALTIVSTDARIAMPWLFQSVAF